MQRGLLYQLNRRKRQLDTLRRMLNDSGQLIEAFQQIAAERELTADEQLDLDALQLRKDRIVKSLDEAEQSAEPR